jgi:hypothetical protein
LKKLDFTARNISQPKTQNARPSLLYCPRLFIQCRAVERVISEMEVLQTGERYVRLLICIQQTICQSTGILIIMTEFSFMVFRGFIVSRDSAVGIVTGYGMDGEWVRVRVPVGARFFFFPRRPDRFWGPPSLLSNRYGALSLGREADPSFPTSIDVRNTGIYIHPLPHTSSMV